MDAATIACLVSVFHQMLLQLSIAFTAPTFQTFEQLAVGWILTPGGGSVAGMTRTLGKSATKHWTVYQKFFYRAAWSLEELSMLVLQRLIAPLLGEAVHLAIDDTTCGPRGRHVAYAGWFVDASSHARMRVIHWAHNWLIGAVLLRPQAFPGMRLALPVLWALHRKKADCDKTHPYRSLRQLAREMIDRVAAALPGKLIYVVSDGFYATQESFAGLAQNVIAISRLRKDASLRTVLPPDTRGRNGRRRLRGDPMPHPSKWRPTQWRPIVLHKQGRTVQRSLYGRTCQWYHVCGTQPVRVVVVKDPSGKVDDLHLVCNRTSVPDEVIVQEFCDRWGIEECIQEAKAQLGMEHTRGWCPTTVSRQAPLAMLLQSLVKLWYVQQAPTHAALLPQPLPWYPHKPHPSFRDMLAAVRRCLWRNRTFNSHAPCKLNHLFASFEYALCAAA
jgi:hypothetical protein